MTQTLRIGTRGSALALVQAHAVQAAVAAQDNSVATTLLTITTTGDRVTDRAFADIGGKALFTKEIDRALLAGEIDCAVHSLKDMESVLAEGLVIVAVLPRGDARDCLVGANGLTALPPGARLGTSAVRRTAQTLTARPDLTILPVRGNVDTRLAKQARGEFDAIILAKAGLERLGRGDAISYVFEAHEMLPAAGQGVIAVVARKADRRVQTLLGAIDDLATRHAAEAERAFVAGLGGSCRSPIGAHAQSSGEALHLTGALFAHNGREFVRERIDGSAHDAQALGEALAAQVKAQASPVLLSVLNEN